MEAGQTLSTETGATMSIFPDLLRTVDRCLESGEIGPIVREELKLTILNRRLQNGQDELPRDDRVPGPHGLRPDEIEKKERRREQNRRAARKCRAKRKRSHGDMLLECQELHKEKVSRCDELTQMQQEIGELKTILHDHCKICPMMQPQTPVGITDPTQDVGCDYLSCTDFDDIREWLSDEQPANIYA